MNLTIVKYLTFNLKIVLPILNAVVILTKIIVLKKRNLLTGD